MLIFLPPVCVSVCVYVRILTYAPFSRPVSGAVGVLMFVQFWYWYPLSHFLSLAFAPTMLIGLNKVRKARLCLCLRPLPLHSFHPPHRPSAYYPSHASHDAHWTEQGRAFLKASVFLLLFSFLPYFASYIT